MAKKHILIISLHADPMLPAGIKDYGGGHMYPYELLVGLSQKDYIVSLFTRKTDDNIEEIDPINTFSTIYRLDYKGYSFHDKTDFYKLKDISFQLAKQMLDNYNLHPDIIHSLYWNSGYLAMQLSQILHIPYVHSPISIGKAIVNSHAKKIEKHRIETEKVIFTNASQLLSITESEKNNIINLYGINKEKITVIGRPIADEYLYPVHDEWGNVRKINNEYFKSPYPPEIPKVLENINWWEKKAFIYVGRIHPNKGIHHIINAWIKLKSQFSEECLPLWIVGGMPEEINQFHKEQNLKIADFEQNGDIIWWGRLTAEGISTLFTRSAALIMHSKYEPGGRVCIESMCSGVPVIATPCGFALDVIKNWNTGFLVDYGDEETLKNRMSMFILQPYLSNSLGANAKEVAIKLTRKWNFIDHHVYVYNKVIAREEIGETKHEDIFNISKLTGAVNAYPIFLPPLSDLNIRQELYSIGAENANIREIEGSIIQGYHIWEASTIQQNYYVIQPYNMLNIFRILDRKRYSKVLLASDIYKIYKKWIYALPSPLLKLNDEKYLIIVNNVKAVDYNFSTFDAIIKFIECYKCLEIQDDCQLWNNNSSIYEIINLYQHYSSELGLFSQGSFSISIEAKLILKKIEVMSNRTCLYSPKIIDFLSNYMINERKGSYYMGGYIFPGSLCWNSGELNIYMPPMLHLAENGFDEGLLLFLSADNYFDPQIWKELIGKIPQKCRYDSVKWAIIFVMKLCLLHDLMENKNLATKEYYLIINILIDIYFSLK